MLTQIGKRMLTLPFPFSRLSDQSKQRLSTCAVGTFVLAPLFPSACNRETSSKCKKGSFLRVLPRKSRHVTKTTLSFTDSACQESDSLPTASFPLFSPSSLLTKPLRLEKEEEKDSPLEKGEKISAHLLLPASFLALVAFFL